MSTKPEEFTYTETKTVQLVDADGRAIRVGSVLRCLEKTRGQADEDRGVVELIVRKGMRVRSIMPACVGDIHIRMSHGVTRVTNRYSVWKHIPHGEQTYEERFRSWMVTPYEHDNDRRVSRDEAIAIDGIMALLPDDIVDWESGPWPDKIENALGFLREHLEELSKAKDAKK